MRYSNVDEQALIQDRFTGYGGKAMTMEQLAFKYRVSRQRVHQILKKASKTGKLPLNSYGNAYARLKKSTRGSEQQTNPENIA